MRIIVDFVQGSANDVFPIVCHTDRAPWNKVTTGGVTPTTLDLIDHIANISKGTTPLAGTGWDKISTHPAYPGKTILDVFKAEIVRLNDAVARAALGV